MRWDTSDPLFANARPARPEILERARGKLPWVTDDYWALLRDVGWGTFGGMGLYEAPVTLASLGVADGPRDFAAFGDDHGETRFGFHPDHGAAVVAFDLEGHELRVHAPSFASWVDALRRRRDEGDEDDDES
jgi:hypothetical protein